ncbi:MAG TPA: adenylate/guanylate cyclase domain-containing protein [bacterium]
MRRDLPAGTVTFLFTDVEGSTKVLHELGPLAYADALTEHRRLVREAVARHGGVEVDTQGDAFFVAFATAPSAVAAAREVQRTLADGPIRIRIGVHTGTPHLTDEGYIGQDVHAGARIAAAGHGGQVLLSRATRELVDEEVTDLGAHRLKDIPGPVRIFQLGAERFPPLRTISNTNLPRPASSFVGRAKEVANVAAQLRDGARLLTLTGPGGSGKTRLAIEAAMELLPSFKAGVFWIGLAPLRDPELVTPTISQALGAEGDLSVHIGDRELLLLLDNFEQVVAAAPKLSALVEACPNVKLLVTSRERLRVRGEVEYPVPPLAEPDAVTLFCARAGVVADDAVHALCRALDDLPLAIELAAARAGVLTPGQILERLSGRLDLLKGGRDADPRQQTLRATIEWSYQLLTAAEQILFARMSIFAGGCTLESAEEVAQSDLDTLQSLVDKNLLRRTQDRFWMLETIREYAAERLEASGQTAEQGRRHAAHFLALADEAGPHLPMHPRKWIYRLEHEHDNFRAALDRLEAAGENTRFQRLAGALWRFWDMRGHVAEGRHRLETALRADTRPTAARVTALNGATAIALESGDTVPARLWAEEALALSRALDDAWGTAHSILLLGSVHAEERDFVAAQRLFEEARRRFDQLGDEHYTLLATRLVAWMCYDQGERDRARALHEDVVRRARLSGNERMQATSLGALAEYAINDGRLTEAIPMLTESTRIYRDLEERHVIAVNLCRFARAAAAMGRAELAARILSSAEALREEIGVRWAYWVVEMNDVTLRDIRTHLDAVAFAGAWEHGQKLTLELAIELALSEFSP